MTAENSQKLTVKEVALMGIMTAMLEVSVHVMAPLPNVEPVTLLIILYTLFLGKKVFYVLAAYLFFEGCFYSFGIWWAMYAYIWPLLSFVTWVFRKKESVWFWSLLAGAFGLFFGALCSIAWFFAGGAAAAFSWWIAGIPYDLIHCVSNIILCLILLPPLRRALARLKAL